MERFQRADELASYMGLTPSEFSTGQYVRQGRITRCGNKRGQTCLVESSWLLIQKDSGVRKKFDRVEGGKAGDHCDCAKFNHSDSENSFRWKAVCGWGGGRIKDSREIRELGIPY